MRCLILFLCLLIMPAFAGEYGVYTPQTYKYSADTPERTLFILDFSNSMTEYLDGESKVDLMLDTMRKILPTISKNSSIGLRVYGHRMGFTPFEACRASTLLVPIGPANNFNIEGALMKTHPRGMTPITYSLKQAIKYESPCKFVMELIKIRKDVVIDVIAFNIDNEDDLAQLECTSLVTSGKFYTANTAAELARSLNSSLNAHKEVEAKIIPNP